jgi:hypothetical protein
MNVVNLGLSALVVADSQPAKEFLRANYSAFYDNLVPMMLAEGKPILMFGSHSIAAFFFFVCFYLHLKSSVARRSTLCFVGAVAYLILLALLKSVSAYFLFVAGLALLASEIRKRHILALVAVTAFAVVLCTALVSDSEWQQLTTGVQKVWTAPESGFRGRYDESGVLAADFEFIRMNPLRGIGIGFSESLWYGDSGPVEFLLRGSVPLVLAVYAAFWFFLTRNILSRRTAITVYLIYFAFEVAYSNLLYLRTICMLPFVIAHLNGLPRGKTAEQPRGLTASEAPMAATQELASC